MARTSRSQHAHQTALANNPAVDISANQWNDFGGTPAHIETGMFGTPASASYVQLSSQALLPVDSHTVVAAQTSPGSGTDSIYNITNTNTNAKDWLFLLPNSGDSITVFHNQGGTGNIFLLGGYNKVLVSGVPMAFFRVGANWYEAWNYNGSISNSNVATNAAIAYSKLNLGNSIVNSDISNSAAIAPSKISGTAAILGANTFTGLQTLNAGLTMSGSNIALGANIIKTTSHNFSEVNFTSVGNVLLSQPSSGNNMGLLAVAPSGTQTIAEIILSRVSDITTNQEYIRLLSDGAASTSYNLQILSAGTGSLRPLNVFMNTTKLLSFDTANTITFYQNLIASNGASYVSPSYLSQNSSWAIDASGSGFSITSSSTYQPFGASNNFAGFCIIENASNGTMCYVAYSGGACLVTNLNGIDFVNSSTPSTSQIGIYSDGSNIFTVKNGFTTTKDIRIIAFRTNNAK